MKSEGDGDLEEKQPLLGTDDQLNVASTGQSNPRLARRWSMTPRMSQATMTSSMSLPEAEPEHVMDYASHDLSTWTTFTFFTSTVFSHKFLFVVALELLGLSLFIAFLLVYTHMEPYHIKALHLDVVSLVLNVFVGLMLAFFLNSSVARWISTVNGFLGLFDAIRNLSMQFHALGVPLEKRERVRRYGLLSCRFLVMELHLRSLSEEERVVEADRFVESAGDLDLEDWEQSTVVQVYKEAHRLAFPMWVWVASLIGRMAQDGEIPPMASPTYGRIMTLAQDAQEGIRQVRASIEVQMPFIYTHTLALLVHSNSIVSAIEFGTSLAMNVSAILVMRGLSSQDLRRSDHSGYSKALVENGEDPTELGCFAAICKSFITRMAAPLIYQAFLQIGLTLSQPFDGKFGVGLAAIPTDKLITNLEKDLELTDLMVEGITGWQQPHFKQPADPKK